MNRGNHPNEEEIIAIERYHLQRRLASHVWAVLLFQCGTDDRELIKRARKEDGFELKNYPDYVQEVRETERSVYRHEPTAYINTHNASIFPDTDYLSTERFYMAKAEVEQKNCKKDLKGRNLQDHTHRQRNTA